MGSQQGGWGSATAPNTRPHLRPAHLRLASLRRGVRWANGDDGGERPRKPSAGVERAGGGVLAWAGSASGPHLQPGQKGRSRPGPMTGHTWGLGPGGSESPHFSSERAGSEGGRCQEEGRRELEGQLCDPAPSPMGRPLAEHALPHPARLEISPGPADTGASAGGCAGP